MSDPAAIGPLVRRAILREQAGELAAAATDYRAAFVHHPEPEFLVALASVLSRMGDRAGQEAALAEALRLNPHSVSALNNLGLLREDAGESDAALDLFERASVAAPSNESVAQNLERLLFEKGQQLAADDSDAAISFYERAMTQHPALGGLHTGLGNLWLDRCEIGKAEAAFRAALERRPTDPDAFINYGIALHRLGRPAEALLLYERAAHLSRNRDEPPELRWNRSLSLLALGRLREGFRDYEARAHYVPFRALPIPRWDGRPFPGQRLLLLAEQGFGDAIQFVRYAAWAKARGGTVTVACDPPLQRLFALAAGVDEVIGPEGLPGSHDWQLPLLSLPHLAGTELETIPASAPYFTLPAAPRAPGLFRVALVWSGNPKYLNDRRRSCPLDLFDALAEIPGIAWTSLQCGPAAAATERHPWLRDASAGLSDFYETALQLNQADLVISVDTATAHLAGALGKPTWVLLPAAPDWRWLMERDDSPWYPTARLFRQTAEGDWAGVVTRVGAALRETVPAP